MIKIEYTSIEKAESYNQAVKSVCKEGKYLGNSTGFPLEGTIKFVEKIIKNDETQFFAIDNDQVIGWYDIIPVPKEFHSHVGILGIGIIKDYRGQKIGQELLKKALKDAKNKGIEKVELEVFKSNLPAQNLYKKIGFEIEGVKKKSKKYQNQYEDVIIMGLMINTTL